jgi:hypothetical protein
VLPSDPLDIFRIAGGPALDIARGGLDNGTMATGDEEVFELVFHAPDLPGHYLVHVDMLQENVRWFFMLGRPGILLPLEVVVDSGDAPENTR